MADPYRAYEGRAVWRALDAELVALEANRDLQLTTARRYVVGALCKLLDDLGLLMFDHHSAVALALREAGWPPAVEEGAGAHALAVAGMGEERLVADYLRVTEAEWAGAAPRSLEAYLPLARAVLEAERREAAAGAPAP